MESSSFHSWAMDMKCTRHGGCWPSRGKYFRCTAPRSQDAAPRDDPQRAKQVTAGIARPPSCFPWPRPSTRHFVLRAGLHRSRHQNPLLLQLWYRTPLLICPTRKRLLRSLRHCWPAWAFLTRCYYNRSRAAFRPLQVISPEKRLAQLGSRMNTLEQQTNTLTKQMQKLEEHSLELVLSMGKQLSLRVQQQCTGYFQTLGSSRPTNFVSAAC